jgi:hypothetical protein
VDATPLLVPVRGPGQGPRLKVTLLRNPMGPASIGPKHFMVELEDFLYSGFFRREALKRSCFDEVFQVTCDFLKKKRTH